MSDRPSARKRVDDHPLWYHTMEVAPGVVTPGWFDLRPTIDLLPWPDVQGKRCLDVGPYDGFLSFELERRGAAEVVAADIGANTEWDWPPDMRSRAVTLADHSGEEVGRGFKIARDLLGSSVERIELSVYDLSPDRVGTFDVVVCGTLMLHLREPIRALEAIRSVCTDWFLSAEEIRPALTLAHPRRPVAELNGEGELCQWWVPNRAAHRRMLTSAGFEIKVASRPFAVKFGPSHPPHSRDARTTVRRSLTRLLTGAEGLAHSSFLASPGPFELLR